MPLLDNIAVHPIIQSDGTLYRDTVCLKNVVDHPRMEMGTLAIIPTPAG